MARKREFIVCFGRDDLLLQAREMLLQNAGFLTLKTSSAYLVRECLTHCNVSILVLCHTLSSEDVSTLVRFHRDMRSSASILSLSAGGRCSLEYGDAHDGPVTLLEAIGKLAAVYHLPTRRPALVM